MSLRDSQVISSQIVIALINRLRYKQVHLIGRTYDFAYCLL